MTRNNALVGNDVSSTGLVKLDAPTPAAHWSKNALVTAEGAYSAEGVTAVCEVVNDTTIHTLDLSYNSIGSGAGGGEARTGGGEARPGAVRAAAGGGT